ncbi:MAG: cupin domain-containing protein [Acidobacteriota bacterium]
MMLDVTLFRWDELALDKVTEMVARKTVSGADLTLTQAYFKKGAVVPLHRHDGERLIYVLQGALRAHVGATDVTVREGDVLVVPADVAHQAESLDDTFVLTVARVPAPA